MHQYFSVIAEKLAKILLVNLPCRCRQAYHSPKTIVMQFTRRPRWQNTSPYPTVVKQLLRTFKVTNKNLHFNPDWIEPPHVLRICPWWWRNNTNNRPRRRSWCPPEMAIRNPVTDCDESMIEHIQGDGQGSSSLIHHGFNSIALLRIYWAPRRAGSWVALQLALTHLRLPCPAGCVVFGCTDRCV